jgi:hypothetical protein
MTPEERARDCLCTETAEEVGSCLVPVDLEARIAAAIRDAVAEEREACARIVLAGGDEVDRLETAITHGPNAAIAAAILARKDNP